MEPGVDDGGVVVRAYSHATQALDPAEGSFDWPAETSLSRTVRTVLR